MMLFMSFLITILSFSPSFAEDEKDWTLDLKTSTLIPKYVGKVKEIKGIAIVEDRELKAGSKIYPQDLIKTEDKSFLKLELIDETLITIGPKSEFAVDRWIYRTKNDREALFTLIKGKIRAEIKSKSREKDQLKFKSPFVSLGIRGTKFLLNNSQIGQKEVSQVALMEGKINLEGSALTEGLSLKPGDYIEIVKDETQQNKVKQKALTKEELQTYLLSELPEQTNLLPDPIIDVDSEKVSLSNVQQNDQTTIEKTETTTDASQLAETTEAKAPPVETVKEKLKKLNEIRQQNLKK